MNFSILFLLSAFIFLVLGYISFSSNKKRLKESGLIFLFFTLATFWWHFFSYLMQITTDAWYVTLFAKIEYTGIIFVPVLLYHFILKSIYRPINLKLKVMYGLIPIFGMLLWGTNLFIDGFYLYSWGVFPSGGVIHSLFIIFVIINTLLAINELYVKNKQTNIDEVKEQTIYLGLSIGVFSLAAFDFIANYGIDVYPVSFISMLVFLGLIMYSTSRYNLISSGLLMGKIFVISSLTIFSYVSLLIFSLLKNSIRVSFIGINEIIFLDLISLYLFIYLLIEVYKKLLKISKDIFDTFNGRENLKSVVLEMQGMQDRKKINIYLENKLNIILKSENYVVSRENSKVEIIFNENENKFSGKEALLWETIAEKKNLIIIAEEKIKNVMPNSFNEKFIKMMTHGDIEILLPVYSNTYILFGKKNDGRVYSREEIDFLKELQDILKNIKF